MSTKSKKFLGKYVIEKTIGEGTYGKVKLALNAKTQQKVALKIIEKDSIQSDGQFKRLENEIRIQHLVRHDNIPKLYEVLENDSQIVFETEFVKGEELIEFVDRNGPLDHTVARMIFKQILEAIYYLHMHFIIHRDIKLENILIDSSLKVKIIDFGFSQLTDPCEMLQTCCGSLRYCSPEIISRRKYSGLASDVWSLGVSLYVILSASYPFTSKTSNDAEIIEKICTTQIPMGKCMTKDSYDLIISMLHKDWKKRPTITEVLQHPWMEISDNEMNAIKSSCVVRTGISNTSKDILDNFEMFGWDTSEMVKKELAEQVKTPVHALYALLEHRQAITVAENKLSKQDSLDMSNATSSSSTAPQSFQGSQSLSTPGSAQSNYTHNSGSTLKNASTAETEISKSRSPKHDLSIIASTTIESTMSRETSSSAETRNTRDKTSNVSSVKPSANVSKQDELLAQAGEKLSQLVLNSSRRESEEARYSIGTPSMSGRKHLKEKSKASVGTTRSSSAVPRDANPAARQEDGDGTLRRKSKPTNQILLPAIQ